MKELTKEEQQMVEKLDKILENIVDAHTKQVIFATLADPDYVKGIQYERH